MPYDQYGQWQVDPQFAGNPWMPGAGMPGVVANGGGSLNERTFGAGWDNPAAGAQQMQALATMRGMGHPQQQPYDSVFTGHNTERVPEDPQLLSMIPRLQQMGYGFGNPTPGYRRVTMGGSDTLSIGGHDMQVPTGADQSWIDSQVQSATPPAMSPVEKSAALMAYLAKQPGMDALKASQIHTRLLGVDPLTLQTKTQDYAKQALEMQKAKDELDINRRKEAMSEYTGLARAGGGLPEDILASFGRNAAQGHENEYFNPGRELPPDEMGQERSIPGGWRGIDPSTVAQLRKLREAMGMGTQPQLTAADLAKLHAEREQLRAAASGSNTPANTEQYGPPDTRLGVRIHNAVVNPQGVPDATGRIYGRAANMGTSVLNHGIDFANFHRQLLSGANAGQAPQLPMPYNSKDEGGLDWLYNWAHLPPMYRH